MRILRVLRVFRILKLAHYVGEARILARALTASRYKITVFVLFIFTLTVIVGSRMDLIEGPERCGTSRVGDSSLNQSAKVWASVHSWLAYRHFGNDV